MMQNLRSIFRLFYIHFILIKYFFRDGSRGQKIRESLVALGPLFVKFGQTLSTRPDIIPKDIMDEILKLTDQVPAFPGMQAKTLISQSLGQPIDKLFAQFDTLALASASISQVHAARTLDNREVVVKILRPKIHAEVKRDLHLLKLLATILEFCWKGSRIFKPRALVEEFAHILNNELDLRLEAANASQLRRHFKDSPLLYVPAIDWQHTKKNVIVMERIAGWPIHDKKSLQLNGVNLRKVAETLIELFFTQVFRDCFFHADMHPGNIFVAFDSVEASLDAPINPPLNSQLNPQLIVVDFGIMGSLSPKDQRYLAENFLALFQRNYQRVALLHQESGWIPKHIRIQDFESAIRSIAEPIFERPIKEISFSSLLLGLFDIARRHEVNIQPQLVLLQKTLMNVEGLARQLDPDLDLWKAAQPFLEKWTIDRKGRALISRMRHHFPILLDKLPTLPELLGNSLQHIAEFNRYAETIAANASLKKSSKSILYFGILLGMGLSIVFILLRRTFL